MSSEVVAAMIAAGAGLLTLVGTLLVQLYGIRRTGRDTEKTIGANNAQLTATLAEQREQLDKTLARERARTLVRGTGMHRVDHGARINRNPVNSRAVQGPEETQGS